MALEKKIANLRTGHANAYWRLTAVSIDAAAGCVAIVLSGYGSTEARAEGRQPDDRRDWLFGPQSFAAVAFQPANGKTVYDVIAYACYTLIRNERRPIVPGTVLEEDGSLILPTGEHVAADLIDKESEPWTVPSEFADALNV